MTSSPTFATDDLGRSGLPDQRGAKRLHLLVFVGDSSSAMELPATGDRLIRRGEGAELRVDYGLGD